MMDPHVRAEAAAWLARLRSDRRSRADERAFRAWLADDEAHSIAFEDVTEAWDIAGAYARKEGSADTRVWTRRAALAGGVGIAAGAAALLLFPNRPKPVRYAAARERRLLTLSDRSRVTLDGDSELEVAFTPTARHLTLVRGRAYFDVAHEPGLPFIARAGDHEVVALGTAFEIEYAPNVMSVLLVEGKVVVRSSAHEAFMRPGDRLTYRGGADPILDRPDSAGFVGLGRADRSR